jgi:hypothetical protein
MLNLADLSLLLVIFFGPLNAFAIAHAHKAGVLATVFFTLGGLVLGISLGAATNKCAYRVLRSKRLGSGAASFIAYLAILLIGMLTVVFLPFLAGEIVFAVLL